MEKKEHRDVSKVSKVVLYSDRALITRTLDIPFKVGHYLVIVENLPDNLNEESLQVSGQGTAKVLIMDVKVKREFFEKVPDTTIRDLEILLEQELEAAKMIQDRLNIIQSQREFLNSIQNFSAESVSREIEVRPPSVEDWQKMLSFQADTRERLNQESYELLHEQREIQDKVKKLQYDLNVLKGAAGKWRKAGIIEIECEKEGDFHMELTYQARNASWKPFYEARVNSETKTVDLGYYGMVVQKTGEDWSGISLELSTARPHIGGNPPHLNPWIMRPWSPPPPAKPGLRSAPKGSGGNRGRKMKKMAGLDMDDMARSQSLPVQEEAPEPAIEKAETRQASVQSGPGATVQFLVPGDSDVPGDGSQSKHKIMGNEFPCKFRYLTIPKLVELAYLNAEVENTSDFPLLPGKMNIFRDGGFIGAASISDLVTPKEKFHLNLGVDEAIRIKRQLLKKKGGDKGIFGKNRKMDYAFQISVENRRSTTEDIIVRDQIPVSRDEKIKIDVTRVLPEENPEKDKDKLPVGTVEWKLRITSNYIETCNLEFTVEYPQDMRVEGIF